MRATTTALLNSIEKEVAELVDMLLSTTNFEQRTKGVGILDRKVARDYSPAGPMIRGKAALPAMCAPTIP